LELINKVQMFQVATSRVNQKLINRNKEPVFNLHITNELADEVKAEHLPTADHTYMLDTKSE
jgi:hypothetical protein